MTQVRLDAISFDAGTQVRASINEQVVSDYAERMSEGVVFPPVVLFHDGNQYYMADGFHRAMAGKRIGLVEIPATVTAGTKTDALWCALGANKANGQRMSESDKRHAIELAYATWPDRGQREVAEQIGCAQSYVGRIREQIQVNTGVHLPDYVTGKDGKKYPASRGPNPRSIEKRAEVAEMVKAGEASNADIASAVGVSLTTVTEVRRELRVPSIDKSSSAVAQRRKDIRDMAERGFTSRQIAAHVGITEQGVKDIAGKEGIVIHADRVVGRTLRHDANRIIEQIVADAENLTEGVNLIDFGDVDRGQIAGWLKSLQVSRDKLNTFIRRLTKEQQHGEAA